MKQQKQDQQHLQQKQQQQQQRKTKKSNDNNNEWKIQFALFVCNVYNILFFQTQTNSCCNGNTNPYYQPLGLICFVIVLLLFFLFAIATLGVVGGVDIVVVTVVSRLLPLLLLLPLFVLIITSAPTAPTTTIDASGCMHSVVLRCFIRFKSFCFLLLLFLLPSLNQLLQVS